MSSMIAGFLIVLLSAFGWWAFGRFDWAGPWLTALALVAIAAVLAVYAIRPGPIPPRYDPPPSIVR